MRARQVQRVRAVAFVCVRGAALVFIVLGVWVLVHRVVGQIGGYFGQMSPFGPQNPPSHLGLKRFAASDALQTGVTAILVGSFLAVLTPRITRFVIRPPEAGCPRCGHELGAGAERCPECGQAGLGGQ